VIFIPPGESTASRKPPKRTRGHYRAVDVDPWENRKKVVESALESGLLSMLKANRKVVHIEDQPPAVEFVNDEGRRTHHTFDFRAHLADGRRIAYAVKPAKRVGPSGLRRTVELIREQSLAGFADEVIIRTGEHITYLRVFNAEQINWARRRRCEADMVTARQVAAHLQGRIRIEELVARMPLGPRAFAAVIGLVDEGLLKRDAEEKLRPNAFVRRTAPASV
jgi:hypothetical protein